MTSSLQLDQIGGAFTTVPGVSIEMLNKGPTGNRTTGSVVFIGVGVPVIPEPGEYYSTFVAPVSGLYQIELVNVIITGSGNWAYFRVVFDYDTVPIYVGGGDDWRIAAYPGDVRQYSFVGTTELTAGSHKVKIEWKVVSGTITSDISYVSKWKIQGLLVSGSGAPGVIKTETTDAVDRSGGGGAVTEVATLATVVTTTVNEVVLLTFEGNAYSTTGLEVIKVYYQLDAGGWVAMSRSMNAMNYPQNMNWSAPVTVATSGSHTFKIGIINEAAGNWTLSGTTVTSRYCVLQYRGGLWPGTTFLAADFVESSQPSATLGNLVRYVPLIEGNTDYVQFQLPVPDGMTSAKIRVHYYMSAANAGNVELHMDTLALSATEDPTAALSVGANFTVTPGNDTLMHMVDESSHATMTVAVLGKDLLVGKLQRTNGGPDTHTADMRILQVYVVA